MKIVLIKTLETLLFKGFIYIVIGGFIFIISRSIHSYPPVQAADVVIFVSTQPIGKVITEVRKFVGNEEGENVTVTRFFYEENNPKNFFQVGGGDLSTMKGEFPLLSTSVLPPWVKGRWCTRVKLGWWPAWSQRAFSEQPKDVCFETSEYE